MHKPSLTPDAQGNATGERNALKGARSVREKPVEKD
jgi:hypothetical protein